MNIINEDLTWDSIIDKGADLLKKGTDKAGETVSDMAKVNYSNKYSLEKMREKYGKNKQTDTASTNATGEGMSWDRTKNWVKGLVADKDGVSAAQNFKDIINSPRIPATYRTTEFGQIGDTRPARY